MSVGVKVAVRSEERRVGTEGVEPCIRMKVVVLIVDASIGSLKLAVIAGSSRTFVASLAGPVARRIGAVVSGATPVVKVQLTSEVSVLPARSLTPVLIEAV